MARKIRKRNRIMLFAAEGHNETEKLYLRDLINDTKGFVLKKAYGTNTDPSGMIKNIIATMNDLGFSSNDGDIAFCFLDLDCDKGKETQLKYAEKIARKHNINVIVSNPCFELWYMCHYTDSPKNYSTSKDLLKDMGKYIKGYEKTKEGIYENTKVYIPRAIRNAKKLEDRAVSKGYGIHTADFSPTNDFYKIFTFIQDSRI